MGLGISSLIALKAAVWFSSFAFLKSFGFILSSISFLYASLVSVLVSIASLPLVNLPILLAKNTDGTFPVWSLVIFSPYLYFVRGFSALRRLFSGEAPYSEICDGLYVGGWPSSLDKIPPGDPAIVDCTCELPRRPEFFKNAYLCIPTWDTRSPQPPDIETAVKWACRKREQKRPVFVHCAFGNALSSIAKARVVNIVSYAGHGRSVTVMCALLVALGVVEDWKDAEKLIKEKRPYICMNALQHKALKEWSKDRLSPSKKIG